MNIITLLRNSGLPMSILLPRMHLSKKYPHTYNKHGFIQDSACGRKREGAFCLQSQNKGSGISFPQLKLHWVIIVWSISLSVT